MLTTPLQYLLNLYQAIRRKVPAETVVPVLFTAAGNRMPISADERSKAKCFTMSYIPHSTHLWPSHNRLRKKHHLINLLWSASLSSDIRLMNCAVSVSMGLASFPVGFTLFLYVWQCSSEMPDSYCIDQWYGSVIKSYLSETSGEITVVVYDRRSLMTFIFLYLSLNII